MLRAYIRKHLGKQILQFLSMRWSGWLVSPPAIHVWKQVCSQTALLWQLSPVSRSLSTFLLWIRGLELRSVNSFWLMIVLAVLPKVPKEYGWAMPWFSGRCWEPRACLLCYRVDWHMQVMLVMSWAWWSGNDFWEKLLKDWSVSWASNAIGQTLYWFWSCSAHELCLEASGEICLGALWFFSGGFTS